jgi:uncharacterized protein (DUF1501 family)
MLPFSDHRLSRRDWLKFSAAGLLGSSTSSWFGAFAQTAAQTGAAKKPKACILLWMAGGPSQVHTFDLKEGAEFQPIATSVPGIQISEHLPRLARQMQHMTLLRSMSTPENEHGRARFLMQKGYRPAGTANYPSLGCIASAELGRPDFEAPHFIAIHGGGMNPGGGSLYHADPAYLGPKHAPLQIDFPTKAAERLQASMPLHELGNRATFRERAEQRFAAQYGGDAIAAHRTVYQQALRLLNSDKVKAFDLNQEPSKLREAYGPSQLGQACLLARRLVEVGVPFVEVTMSDWDDHDAKQGAAPHVQKRSPILDAAMATLIGDLHDRGLLENTLVIWMGEFGRNPTAGKYGAVRGGGHYSRAWTTVLAGGGLKTGQVIGQTDATGLEVIERPISAPEYLATICQALGIDYTKSYDTPEGRAIPITEKGAEPIKELFS